MTGFCFKEGMLDFLLSEGGQKLLGDLARADVRDETILSHTMRLRRRYPADMVAAAIELTCLRKRARSKFLQAGKMFFTREALEQASGQIVARHTACRFVSFSRVVEMGCGIGGDTIALAQVTKVLAVDDDPTRLRMARANVAAHSLAEQVTWHCGDALRVSLAGADAVWADPGRRNDRGRIFSVHRYKPPLPGLLAAVGERPTGVKLAPGVDYAELASLLQQPFEVEIVSLNGEVKEAVLWTGAFCTAPRRATVLLGTLEDVVHASTHTLAGSPQIGEVEVTYPGRYLYEPNGAVIRAHLVEQLALSIGATKIDEQIAYLTSDRRVETPFATAYQVDEVMPFHLKSLNRRLLQMDIGELVIKKRGSPIDPERFRKRLKYRPGARKVVLFVTRIQDRPSLVISTLL